MNINKVVAKQRRVLIMFKTMQEILNEEASFFDQHGNLCVPYRGHLAPIYFKWLGKQEECHAGHGYPDWCIRRQWDDLFYQNMALRHIASGKMDPADAVQLAKDATLIPEKE